MLIIEYHKTDINETIESYNYDDDAYDELLDAKVLLPNTEVDSHIYGTLMLQESNSMNQPHKDIMHNTVWCITKMSNGTKSELHPAQLYCSQHVLPISF